MKCNSKRIKSLSTILIFLFLINLFLPGIPGLQAKAAVEVTNTGDLTLLTTTTPGTETFILTPAYQHESMILNGLPNAHMIVDGNNMDFDPGFIYIQAGNNAQFTFKNMHFAPATAASVFQIYTTEKIVLSNIWFDGYSIDFLEGVLWLDSHANVEIVNCTFSNNRSRYHGGAISAANFAGTLSIKNCVFIGNSNTDLGFVTGGEGGAISINGVESTAKISITDCYFEGNETPLDMTNVSANDVQHANGGAIALLDVANGASVTLKGNTFYQNTAGNAGGAITLRTSGSVASGITLENNTFYQNTALSQENNKNLHSGGAIHLYASGADYIANTAYVDVKNNTFVENKADSLSSGGAIGTSGYLFIDLSSSIKVQHSMIARLSNNIFLKNTGFDENYNNLALQKGEDAGGNLGFDSGTKTQNTPEEVFGNGAYGANGSTVKAGYAHGAVEAVTVPTFLIKPEGTADDILTGAALPTDQRGRTRNASASDIGSVEIKWLKFDANTGVWNDFTQTGYNINGSDYTVINTISSAPDLRFAVDTVNANTVTAPGKPVLAGYDFVGWSNTKFTPDSGTADDCVDETALTYSGQTLYAVWAIPTNTVTYKANKGTGTDHSVAEKAGTAHNVLSEKTVGFEREGYTFLGWSTDSNAETAQYSVGEAIALSGNLTLYAVWKLNVQQKQHYAYIIGYTNATVQPNRNISREEMSTVFMRILEENDLKKNWKTVNSFPDVEEKRWSSNAISTLEDMGVVIGYPGGKFRPANDITRAEFAAMMVRFAGLEGKTAGGNHFSDVKSTSWAANDINLGVEHGLFIGYEDGTFRQNQSITRAEVMASINRFLGRRVRTTADLLPDMETFSDNSNTQKWYYFDVQIATNSYFYVDYTAPEDNITYNKWIKRCGTPQWHRLCQYGIDINSFIYPKE